MSDLLDKFSHCTDCDFDRSIWVDTVGCLLGIPEPSVEIPTGADSTGQHNQPPAYLKTVVVVL